MIHYLLAVRLLLSVAVLALLVGLAGCAPAERLVPASGKVTVKNQLLPAGIMVVFHPNTQKGNTTSLEPRGQLDAQGVYRLQSGDREGAPSGWYRVAVFAIKPTQEMRPPEWLANPRYADPKTSGLEVQVVENPAPGAYDFALRP
jgi:hypothetical protein